MVTLAASVLNPVAKRYESIIPITTDSTGIAVVVKRELICDERSALMFQEPRLLPWKNALDNIRAVLSKDNYPLADKYLALVGLECEKHKMPRELSGGMAQRVSFARFLAFAEASSATLLLLDEPFSALDKETAEKMINILCEASKGKTVILITHDLNQAKSFANDIIMI